MKIEVLQENLNKALTIATRLVSSKPQLPILSNLLITASKEGGKITASNIESTIVIPFGVKVEEPGEIIVPARTLQELVASLSSGKISLETLSSSLIIKENKFQAKIALFQGGEFPKTQSDNSKSTWSIASKEFLQALSQTIFSAAIDETRAVLNGVLFKFDAQPMFVATDGFRLSKYQFISQSVPKTDISQVVIPAKALSEVTRLLNDAEKDDLTIGFSDNQVFFQIDNIEFFTQTIAGNYPDFEKIIPPSFNIKIKLAAEELLKAVKTAAIFARENANIIRFNLKDKSLIVKAQGGEVGENETELDIEMEKGSEEDFSVAFNFRYVLDFLNSISGEKDLTLELGTPTSPALFRPAKSENYLHIIMPVRVQS